MEKCNIIFALIAFLVHFLSSLFITLIRYSAPFSLFFRPAVRIKHNS